MLRVRGDRTAIKRFGPPVVDVNWPVVVRMVESVEGKGETRPGITRSTNAIATTEERVRAALAASGQLCEEDDRGQEPPRRVD